MGAEPVWLPFGRADWETSASSFAFPNPNDMEITKPSSEKNKKTLKTWQIIALVFLALFVIGKITGENRPVETVQTPPIEATIPDSEDDTEETTVTLLGTDHNNAVENFDFLVTTTDLSEENISVVAKDIKTENCSRKCNIWLYDDESAYKLQKEYDALDLKWREEMINGQLTSEELESNIKDWEENNYVFFADHYLGSLTFDSDDLWMYPYKDAKYATLMTN